MGGSLSPGAQKRFEKGNQNMPVDENRDSDLHMLAKDGPPPLWLEKCIVNQKAATINCVNDDGYSAFYNALIYRNEQFCKMLLKHPKLVVNQIHHGLAGESDILKLADKSLPRIGLAMRRHPNFDPRNPEIVGMTYSNRLKMADFLGCLGSGTSQRRARSAAGRPAPARAMKKQSKSSIKKQPGGSVMKKQAVSSAKKKQSNSNGKKKQAVPRVKKHAMMKKSVASGTENKIGSRAMKTSSGSRVAKK